MDRNRASLTLRGAAATAALLAVPIAFLGYFFAFPVARILWQGIAPAGSVDPAGLAEALADRDLLGVAWFTLWQATLSTALTLAIALPGAYVFARYDFPGKSLLRAAITVPFVLPTVVVGSAFLALLGPRGPLGLGLEHSIWAILAAHVFYNYAVVVRTVGGLWAHLDPDTVDAARTLGASPWRAFRHVTLPLLRPAIAAAAAIVFLFTFTSFGVVLILGGRRYATIEVEIYRQATGFLDLTTAAALALVQLVGVVAIMYAYSRHQERRAAEQSLRPAAETARRPRLIGERAILAANLAVMALLLGAPLAVLVERSVRTPAGYGLDFYRALGDDGGLLFTAPVVTVRNSLAVALGATLIALAVGMAAAAVIAYRRGRISRWFDTLLMLPLGTSAVTVGFGMLIALPPRLRVSVALLPIAHALVAVPFVVRSVVPVMRAVRHRLREAAAVLGASPARAWREVDLPIISRATLVGAGFALAISLGEFGATAFLVRPDLPTLPIGIFRFLGQPGVLNFGRAMALSVILMVITGAAVLAVERFRFAETGEF